MHRSIGINPALILVESLPRCVRKELLADTDFALQHDLDLGSVLTFNDVSFVDADIEDAIGGGLDKDQIVSSITGEEFVLRLADAEHLVLEREDVSIRLDEFLALSSDERFRRIGEAAFVARIGPGQAAILLSQAPSLGDALTDSKVLVESMNTSVEGVLASLSHGVRTGSVGFDKLVPSEIGFYEQLIGSARTDIGRDDWLFEVWRNHCSKMLDVDLAKGFELAAFGSISPISGIVSLLEDFGDDDLVGLLENVDTKRNPFAFLSVVNVCFDRWEIDEFRKLGSRFVEEYIEAELGGTPTFNYELLSGLTNLIENRLSELFFRSAPIYFVRLASYVHAGLVCIRLLDEGIDVEGFCEWTKTQRTADGEIARNLEYRNARFMSLSEASSEFLRAEVLGRLLNLRAQYFREDVPGELQKIDALKRKLEVELGPMCYCLPGPLEDRVVNLASELETALRQAVVDSVREGDSSGWNKTCYVLQLVDQDVGTQEAIRSAFDALETEDDGFFEIAFAASTISLIESDKDLALAVTQSLCRAKWDNATPHEVHCLVMALIRCSWIDETGWGALGEWTLSWCENADNTGAGHMLAYLSAMVRFAPQSLTHDFARALVLCGQKSQW